MNIPGKKVTVLGLGISGLQSALFLKTKGFDVFVSDSCENETLRQRSVLLQEKGVQVEMGKHSLPEILQSDWILISPGISPASNVYQEVVKKKIPVYSEIEVASWYCPSKRIIAVTGTCGKTTVTTLLSEVLKRTGYGVITCGNIGNPWIGELEQISPDDYVVLELSSFQLEHCSRFRPYIGILLNLSPNHEDWHKDMAEYAASKLKMFQSQSSSDIAILRQKDQREIFPDHPFAARVLYLDKSDGVNPNEEVLRMVADLCGCPMPNVDQVIRSFEGIEHRLESFLVSGDVRFVNDSKSTTVSSLLWALDKFPDRKIVLIAGGHPKSTDFDTVRSVIARKVKTAILIGEARSLLRDAWKGACPFYETDNFRQAIEKAIEAAGPGDTVLLSPACASFDMFNNYKERGTLFKSIVRELVSSVGSRHV